MYTPEDHPDYESVKRALAMIEEVTVGINEHVRQEEKVRKRVRGECVVVKVEREKKKKKRI
jgi:hypothetical protein